MRDRARDSRKTLTVSEQRLWNWLRNRTFSGYKFRRQFPIGPYVLDFYCPELKFAIEVDGHQHELPCVREYDERRTHDSSVLGIRVLRVPNVLLATDSRLVEEQLRFAIEECEAGRR